MSRIKCRTCGEEMNVSTGTFGAGLPKDCPECKKELDYEVIADDWKMEDGKWLSEVKSPHSTHNEVKVGE